MPTAAHFHQSAVERRALATFPAGQITHALIWLSNSSWTSSANSLEQIGMAAGQPHATIGANRNHRIVGGTASTNRLTAGTRSIDIKRPFVVCL